MPNSGISFISSTQIHRNLPRGSVLWLMSIPFRGFCLSRNLFALFVPFFASFWNCMGCTFGRFGGIFGLPFEVIREGVTDLVAATGRRGDLPVTIAWLFWVAIGVRSHNCGVGRMDLETLFCKRVDDIDRSKLGSDIKRIQIYLF